MCGFVRYSFISQSGAKLDESNAFKIDFFLKILASKNKV